MQSPPQGASNEAPHVGPGYLSPASQGRALGGRVPGSRSLGAPRVDAHSVRVFMQKTAPASAETGAALPPPLSPSGSSPLTTLSTFLHAFFTSLVPLFLDPFSCSSVLLGQPRSFSARPGHTIVLDLTSIHSPYPIFDRLNIQKQRTLHTPVILD